MSEIETKPNDRLLTPDAVARRLGVTVGTLENWRCTGRYSLPFVKLNHSRSGRVFYRASDVDAFITRHVLVSNIDRLKR